MVSRANILQPERIMGSPAGYISAMLIRIYIPSSSKKIGSPYGTLTRRLSVPDLLIFSAFCFTTKQKARDEKTDPPPT